MAIIAQRRQIVYGTYSFRPYDEQPRIAFTRAHIRPPEKEVEGTKVDAPQTIQNYGEYKAFSVPTTMVNQNLVTTQNPFNVRSPGQVLEFTVCKEKEKVIITVFSKKDDAFEHYRRVNVVLVRISSEAYERGDPNPFAREAREGRLELDLRSPGTRYQTKIILDREEFKRIELIEVYLGQIPVLERIAEYISMLKEPTSETRCLIISRLSVFRMDEGIKAIVDRLIDPEEYEEVRICAAETLTVYAKRSHVFDGLQIAAVKDISQRVRIAAIKSLVNGDRVEAKTILRIISSTDENESVRTLASNFASRMI
ncbi:HEAT repeat domain-containing protein [Candidatus Micrarchaeota archaeon]|nr:HEAT repeat domain-containing protein [Candidatus Micrarchaeota archaeon]